MTGCAPHAKASQPGVRIREARREDAAAMLEVQLLAFAPAAERYADPALPPLLETVEDIAEAIAGQTVLVATSDEGRIIGAVRGSMSRGCVYVGRLVVAPSAQRQGVATALMKALEACFPNARCFELFTGGMNEPGMGLYLKSGYREVRRERKNDLLEIVYLRKRARAACRGAQEEQA